MIVAAADRLARTFATVARRADERLASGRRVCMRTPGGGRLLLDRRLPFLVVHRRPPKRDDGGTAELPTALSSYLLAPGDRESLDGVRDLVATLGERAAEELGAALLIEIWTRPEDDEGGGAGEGGPERPVAPRARIVPGPGADAATVEALRRALEALRMCPENGGELGIRPELVEVVVGDGAPAAPEGMEPLVEPDAGDLALVGLELTPFFRDRRTGRPHPRVLQALRRSLAEAVEKAVFDFASRRTELDAPHPFALARRTLGSADAHVDRRLGEVFGAFDTLLQVTPVNTEVAWERFRSSSYEAEPELRYRPLPFDPEHLKRRLFHLPIERVEDPLLNYLFREKQEELDREITLLRELGTDRFIYASVQLHGGVDDALMASARAILDRLPPPPRGGGEEEYASEDRAPPDYVGCEAFAAEAMAEIERYREDQPDFTAGVEIRDDVSGLMVSRGVLRIGRGLCVPRARVRALVQHEVGTHVVTYFNGTRQPLSIFASGLAGYEPLQEGLAVLAEYLVGGLSPDRLRILAARVVGVRALLEGADFVETFRLLEDAGFRPRSAFLVTVRIHRGGGYTKDSAYLRGLRALLAHLRRDGAVDPLLVGKLGLDHSEVVQELVLRGVLNLPRVRPRWARGDAAATRLARCRTMDLIDLVEDVRTTSAEPRAGANP